MDKAMITTPLTPTRKVIFRFDEHKFAKTISRLTEELLKEVAISVWAIDPTGKCINILKSSLGEEDFDRLAKSAEYTIYEGTNGALSELGVV